MKIEKDHVVSIHYRLSEAEQLIEDSHESKPMTYLHGHGAIFPAIEEALTNKTIGDKTSITLTPEQTYGERDESALQRVSINHVVRQGKKKTRLKPGMQIHLNTKNGPQPAIVIKAGLKSVDVDVNHPYAGKTLSFDIEVIAIREASAEEIAHKHVHGEGGHQH